METPTTTPKRKKRRRVRKDTGSVNTTPKRPEKRRRIPHEIQSTIEDLPLSLLPDLESGDSGACQSSPGDNFGAMSSSPPHACSQAVERLTSEIVLWLVV